MLYHHAPGADNVFFSCHRKENLPKTRDQESGPTSDFSEEAPTTFGPYTEEKLMVKSQLTEGGTDWISVEKKDVRKGVIGVGDGVLCISYLCISVCIS